MISQPSSSSLPGVREPGMSRDDWDPEDELLDIAGWKIDCGRSSTTRCLSTATQASGHVVRRDVARLFLIAGSVLGIGWDGVEMGSFSAR